MSTETDYDAKFYEFIEDGSRQSASAIVPHVRRLFPHVESIVDFGCGNGVWLAEFERSGIKKIQGLDFGTGAESRLMIPLEKYRSANLGTSISVEPHDLCVSLEVAEHVAAEFSDIFVNNLANSAPRILFSAAIPNQGGHHHINEQPPDYWISKFNRAGFDCLDVIRPIIWGDDRVRWWYKQNILIFISRDLKREIKSLSQLQMFGGSYLIHPDSFQERHQQLISEVGIWNERVERLKGSMSREFARPFHRMLEAARNIFTRKD
jgi:hypothetical protein